MPLAVAADRMRSGLSPKNDLAQALALGPDAAGPPRPATLSKNRVYCFSGAMISTGSTCLSRPGVSVSTTNRESRPRPVSGSTPERVTTRMASHSSTPEM